MLLGTAGGAGHARAWAARLRGRRPHERAYAPSTLESLVDPGRIADQVERKALYVKAQELVREETPLLPIAHSLVVMPIRKEVRGYVLDPFGRQNFARVDLAN